MNTSEVTDTFLELLQQSGLLTPKQFASFTKRLAEDESVTADLAPDDVANRLLAEGLITPFQAQRLLEGRSRGFFIDDYKLTDVLGTGGMGGVYVAEDTRTGEQVALKVLSERHRHDSGMLARLKLEALAGARLKHPHIVQTDAIGHTGAIDYLVMEFVEGITLQELVTRQGPRPWPQACDFMAQAASGLQHAHQAGLVHRDIKPSNLLILRDGGVKILDFGLALLSDQEDNEFSLAMIFGHECIGSADYMPPEQSRNSSQVDARADIYSLGCTMYSALTGAFPFPEESASKMIHAHRTKTAKPIQELAPEVPDDVAAIVEKMMAKRPEERYQTAAEVQQALQPFRQREPVSFDFEAVLSVRAEDEKRRSAAYRKQQSSHRRTPTGGGSGHSTSSLTTATSAGAKTDRVTQPAPSGPSAESSEVRGSEAGGPAETCGETATNGREAPAPQKPGKTHRPVGWDLSDQSNRQESATPVSPASRAALIPLDGGTPIRLTSDRVLIGRDPNCDVQLSESGVSGRHCELCFEGGWWRVTDLNSKNGTRVNGTAIHDRLLWSGDRLTIAGKYRFRFQVEGSSRRLRRPTAWKWFLLGLLAAALTAAITVIWLW